MGDIATNTETILAANGIELCAEVRGPQDGDPLLLVMGLGAQLVSWDDGFVGALVERGFRVIRFDNRDVGRSTKFDDQPVNVFEFLAGGDDRPKPPYVLNDMASDAIGLLDALGIDRAHIVGASMGGMIVQQMAIDHPDRVKSVTSIMSTTGDADVGSPTPEAMTMLTQAPPQTVEQAIEAAHAAYAVIGSPAYPDPEAVEARARREFERGRNPAGFARQLAAILSSPSRTEALRTVAVPFLVIHGKADTLVTVSGGQRTADAVPGSTYLEIDGMGHNLPKALWPAIIDAIADNAANAEA